VRQTEPLWRQSGRCLIICHRIFRASRVPLAA